MKVTTIRVGKSVEALGLWMKLDLEASIGENENPETAHAELKEMLDKLLPSVNGSPYHTINAYAPPIIDKKKEDTEIAIDNSSSKEELKLLMNDAMKYDLVKQYLTKLQTLQP